MSKEILKYSSLMHGCENDYGKLSNNCSCDTYLQVAIMVYQVQIKKILLCCLFGPCLFVIHNMYVRMYVYMYLVCMYVFIKLHITTQSGPVILVILCHCMYVCIY